MKTKIILILLAGIIFAGVSYGADDGPLVGVIDWLKYRDRKTASEYDKTDFWAGIALSPSTGKFASICSETSKDNAGIIPKDKCNAKDARPVVLCCNGWCSLALGVNAAKDNLSWGVGWGGSRETAERYALETARERDQDAKVVYSIFAREPLSTGAIAYAPTTGRWGYSSGYGRGDASRAVNYCGDQNAKVFVDPQKCSWMALALGDDKDAYGWAYAGNRIDAENSALAECRKQTKNAKIAVSFCTNGISH